MDSRGGVLHSAPLGGRSASPFKAKMSAKVQEEGSQGRSTAPKLPHFPAKKGSALAVASSPAKAPRDNHLPGMPAAGAQSGRAHPGKGGRQGASGADKLAQLSKPGPGAGSDSGGGADDAVGFDSPRRGIARAQVARDEVLAYMRRQKAEPRDTSFDDDDRAPPSRPAGGAAAAAAASGPNTAQPDASAGQPGRSAGRDDGDGSLSFSLDFMEAYRTRPSTAAAAAAAEPGAATGAAEAGAGPGPRAEAAGAGGRPAASAGPGAARGRQQGLRGSESFDAEELLRRYSLGRGRLGGRREEDQEESEDDEVEEDIADDTTAVSGPDQSPTRHTPSGARTAGGGASRARAPGRPASAAAAAPAAAPGAAARASMSRSRATRTPTPTSGASGGGVAVMRLSLSIAAAVASPLASSVALTDDAFELFKRDIAARVIQVHWRRWLAWKAKVRRDAEQRILQQLFADDPSGLSLKLLLGEVGGAEAASGSASGGAAPGVGAASAHPTGQPSAAAANMGEAEASLAMPMPNRSAPIAAGVALEKQPSGTRLPALKRPASTGAAKAAPAAPGASSVDAMGHLPAAAAAAAPGLGSGSNTPRKSAAGASLVSLRATGKVDTGVGSAGRSGTPGKRPVSAADAYAQTRTESILADDRGRRRPATAGAALVGSPGGGVGGAASAFEDSLDVEDTEWQEAVDYDDDEDNPHAVRATPRKAHKGGHAVYTFVATPRRRAAAEAAAAAAAAEAAEATRPHPEPAGSADTMRDSRKSPRAEAEAAPAPQPQPQRPGQQPEQQPGWQEKLQLREPSLDADANPAMASPALSALTGEAGGAMAGAAGAPGGNGGADAVSWTEDDAQSRPSGFWQSEANDAMAGESGASASASQADAAGEAGQQLQRQASSGRRMEALQRLRQQGSQRALGLSSSGTGMPSAPAGTAADASGSSRAGDKGGVEGGVRQAPQNELTRRSGSDHAHPQRADERQRRDAGPSGQDRQARQDERVDHDGSSTDVLEASLRSMGDRNRRAAGAAGGRDVPGPHDRGHSHRDPARSDQQHEQRAQPQLQPQQPKAPHPPAERQHQEHTEQRHRERKPQQQHHHQHHRDSVAADDGRRPVSAAAALEAGYDRSAHARRWAAHEGEESELAGPSGRGQPRPASAFAAAPPAQPRDQQQQPSARAQQLRQSRHPGRRVFSDSDDSEEDGAAVEEPAATRHAPDAPRRLPDAPASSAAASGHHHNPADVWAERRGGARDEVGRHDERAAPREAGPALAIASGAQHARHGASSGRPSSGGVERDTRQAQAPQVHQAPARQQPDLRPQQEATAAPVAAASRAAAGGGHQQQQQPRPQQAEVAASLTAAKMTSILKYLDEVELQAEQEAACATVAPALLLAEPSTAAALAAMAAMPGFGSRPATAAAASARSRGGPAGPARPSTAHAAGGAQIMTQRSLAALSDAGGRSRQPRPHSHARARGMGASCRSGFEHDDYDYGEGRGLTEDGDDVEDGDDDLRDADAASVGAASAVSGLTAGRPAFLAESVYESVRAKIRRLQEDVRERDDRIAELGQEVEALTAAQRAMALEGDARLSELLAAQRAEYEGAVARHLAFVDRLLADKEALTARAEQLEAAVRGADDKQERAIAKLKEGWAQELRRQKEGWAAAEKQRREAWMAAKAAEIKDMTVKGLEGEVQKLLSRHKAELSAAQQAAADEARRHLDNYVAQNEAAVRQLKERMAREAEEAVEKERGSAGLRLREVSERYEQQLQTQRMRLVSDADLRLEHLEQARKEDKKRYEEALGAAREAAEARQRDMEDDWRREKEALRKAHDKQIESLREQYETGQEGWRAAMAERARKEVAERVAAIREKLLEERNNEIQAVMTRLEEEHAGAVEALKEDFRRREEAAAAKAAAALKEAKRSETKMAERFRCAGAAAQTAEERVAAAELAAGELRRELEQRNSTIRWLEGQVSVAKEEAAARERDLRSLGADKAAVAAEAAAAANRERQTVEARLAAAHQEMSEMRNKHGAEMAHVEARVKATLARKDEVIAGLREQLATLAAELRGTQEVLRLQQEELGR